MGGGFLSFNYCLLASVSCWTQTAWMFCFYSPQLFTTFVPLAFFWSVTSICYENIANICNNSWGGRWGVDLRTPLTCKLNYQHLLRQRSVLDAVVWVWKCRGVMQCSETPLLSWEKSLQVVSSTLNYWARRSLVTLCKTFTAELDDTLSVTSKNAHIWCKHKRMGPSTYTVMSMEGLGLGAFFRFTWTLYPPTPISPPSW